MADNRRKHSGKNHLTREGWNSLNSVAFCRKTVRCSTCPQNKKGEAVIVEHIDPRRFSRVMQIPWPQQQ